VNNTHDPIRKRTRLLSVGQTVAFAVSVWVLVAGLGCEAPRDLVLKQVTCQAADDGKAMEMKWTAVGSDVSEIDVFADGQSAGTLSHSDRSYKQTTPVKHLRIRGVGKGGLMGDDHFYGPDYTWSTSFIVSQPLTVYALGDSTNPDHKCHGFWISSADSQAHGLAYDDSERAAYTSYVIADVGDSLFLIAPDECTPMWAFNDNVSIAVSQDFAELKVCPGSEYDYRPRTLLKAGQTYALWLKLVGDDWSPLGSTFVKAKVESINGKAVTMTFGWQTAPGLRWVTAPAE
jgi:hypothetical protein